MIRQLAADGKAILISSHILTELAEMCDMVGIIELGRLLAVGSVDEIQRGQQAEHESLVHVRLLEAAQPLAAWLAPRPDVLRVSVEGDQLTYVHGGSRDAEAATLRAMIEAGFRVVSFGHQTKTLEEVFMQVTKGHVQ